MEIIFHIHVSTLLAFSLHLISKQCFPDQDVLRTNVNNSQYWSLFTDVCIVVVVLLTTNVCGTVSSMLSGLETRSLELNTLGTT